MVALRREAGSYVVEINARRSVRVLHQAGLTKARRPRLYYRRKDIAEEVRSNLRRAERERNWRELERLYREHRSRLPSTDVTLEDLVEQFIDVQLKGERTTAHWRRVKRTRLRKFLEHAKATLPEDVTYGAAERFLGVIGSRWTPKTRHDYAETLKSFSRWLRRHRHLEVDPLEDLNAGTKKATTQRRASPVDEVLDIMAALPVRLVVAQRQRYGSVSQAVLPTLEATGYRHQLIIATLFATAMRPGELRALCWQQLALEAAEIRFDPGEVKTGRFGEAVYLAPWLVERLRAWRELAGRAHNGVPDPGARVIRVEKRFIPNHLIPAARYAGVDLDPRRGTLDLHAIGRTSLSTWLTEEADLDGHLADLFTRHKLQGSTRARNYVKRRPDRMREIAARIPSLFELLAARESSSMEPSIRLTQEGLSLTEHEKNTAPPTGLATNEGEAVGTSCPKRDHA